MEFPPGNLFADALYLVRYLSDPRLYPVNNLYAKPMSASKISAHKIPLNRLDKAKVPHMPGVFLLYRTNASAPALLGRSDASLYNAIRKFVHGTDYRYFKFMPTRSGEDAFKYECMFWHKFPEDQRGAHPHHPRGKAVECPHPNCDYGADFAATVAAETLVTDSLRDEIIGDQTEEYQESASPDEEE